MHVTPEALTKAMQKGMARKPANVWPIYRTNESLDRTAFVTSSEIGYCERKVFFDKQALKASTYSPKEGTTQVATGWGMMERGHVVEAWFIETILRGFDSSQRLLFVGDNQRSFVFGKQSGTPDGVFLIGPDQVQTLEVKSFDPRTNVTKFPKKEHVNQITQNCDLVEVALDKECIGTMLVYIDASDYERIFPFFIPFDHSLATKLESRAKRILDTTDAAELDPEGVYAGHCGYCRHTAACNALTRKPVKEDMRNAINSAASKLFGKL